MNKIGILLLLCLTILGGCDSDSVKVSSSNSQSKKSKEDIKQNLYLFLEEGFNDDYVEIRKNNEVVVSERTTTDESTGLGGYFKLGKRSEIETLTIEVEGKRDVIQKEDIKTHLLYVRILNDSIKLGFYDEPRVYE